MLTDTTILSSLADLIAERVLKGLNENHPDPKQSGLLSVPEVAKRLGRTAMSVRHLIAQGKLPSVRCDRRVFVDAADVDHFIEANKHWN